MSKKRLARVCRNCNSHFEIYPYKAATARYCSRVCADKGKSIDSRNIERMAARFWKYVDRRGPVECWPWIGASGAYGYGSFGWGGRCTATGYAITAFAHRFALAVETGRIGPDMRITTDLYALHSCDNRKCCNPAHLRWGTHLENIQDMVERGRVQKGETHYSFLRPEAVPRGERRRGSKLTNHDVYAIRRRFDRGGVTAPQLSEEYGVSRASIDDILQRRTWRHIV